MKIINLSASKLEYTLNNIIESFEKCDSVKIEKLVYTISYMFKYSHKESLEYRIEFSENKLNRITICCYSRSTEIDYTFSNAENKGLINGFKTRFFKRLCDIENEQFKKVFSSYDGTEERDGKLNDLLSEEQEIKEEKIIKTEPLRKQWYQLL